MGLDAFLRAAFAAAAILASASFGAGPALAQAVGAAVAEHRTAQVNGIKLRYRVEGAGDLVVLLHGWPQTGHEWRLVAPLLVRAGYTVVTPDLRGLGDSERPANGYNKRTSAEDIHQLVRSLGRDRAFVVGHDIGGAVAFAYAAAYPDEVTRLAVVEMLIPGFGLEATMEYGRDKGSWHWPLHAKAPDVAERLVSGREREYLGAFFLEKAFDPKAISQNDIDRYAAAYAQPGALRAGFQYYATIWDDADHNRTVVARGKLQMPVLALGGSAYSRAAPLESLRRVAANVTGGVVERAGHWVPEEQPQELARRLAAFFAGELETGGPAASTPGRDEAK